MKNVIKMLVAVAVLGLAVSSFAQTNESSDGWRLVLGGAGSTSTVQSGGSAFGLQVDIAREGVVWLPTLTGVRQSVAYANNNGSQTLLGTTIYNDWTVLKVKKFEGFVGANVGIVYGNTTLKWTAAPEMGVRYAIRDGIFLVGRIEYAFNLNNGGKPQDALGYSIGVQFKL